MFRDRLARLGLGLEDRMKQKVGLLSGGQRRALTLLMATIVEPKLLLLDEHTAALDPSRPAGAALTRICGAVFAVYLMVTHNMKNALEYGTRTIMMHDGSIILDISGQERREMTVEKLHRPVRPAQWPGWTTIGCCWVKGETSGHKALCHNAA